MSRAHWFNQRDSLSSLKQALFIVQEENSKEMCRFIPAGSISNTQLGKELQGIKF
jgi:hypothetical protein